MGLLALLLLTFIVLIVVALTKVIAQSLNLNEFNVMLTIVIFVFGYMMYGGANSMVYTNTIQAAVMLLVAIILLTSGYEHFSNGVKGFLDQLAAIDPVLIKPVNPQSPLFRNFYEIIFAQIVVGIAIVVQPHIITKSLLLKKESDVNKFLVTSIIAEVLFFAVVIAGLYARISFPDLTLNGAPLANDNIIPAYVVETFSNGTFAVIVGLFVVLGLIAAGMSTLEGLIQSVSTTITSDLIQPLFGHKIQSDRNLIRINKAAIIVMALVTLFLANDQLINPKLSVGIFAQNGVYAYFSAAFVPVIFGIFFKKVKVSTVFTATITAITVHFLVYYGLPALHQVQPLNLGFFTIFIEGKVRNPAIAASTAIVVSSVVGLAGHFINHEKHTKA
jgi:sodium/pantothenate symporter